MSVPTNIAEGCGRSTQKDFARFPDIAFGSASEVEYLLWLSRDPPFLDEARYLAFHDDAVQVKRMLAAFSKKLKTES